MTRVGVDEAGKGPVLGPMVCAAVRAPPDALPEGVDDSKRLSAAERERLATVLRADPDIAVATAAVDVDRIDDPKTDMNGLTVAGQTAAVSEVAVDGDRVVADAGDVDADRFGRRVADGVKTSVEMVAEHGADERYAVVGAASVVAKVERDRRMAAIGDRHETDVGSGYPSDPTTRAFLRSHVEKTGDLPACARRSWATCEEVLAATAQSGLDDFHDSSS